MMKEKDDNSYRALNTTSHVTCDFCDKEFDNRYDSIIHNASHIIIPLLKGSILHCKICNTYYTSLEDLHNHNSFKHPVKHKKINVTEINCEKKHKEKIHVTEIKVENFKNEPIRNRLKFEDDFSISNGLIKDLVTECKVNVQLFDPPWLTCTVEENDIDETDIIDLTSNLITVEPSYKSISYSCLMKPGIYNCRICFKSYPNRFTLIKHEKHHIRLSKGRPLLCTMCDRYIAGNYHNLHAHIEKFHPGSRNRKSKTHTCKRCNLRFKRYKRHVRNYHIYDCDVCGMECNTADENENHRTKCNVPVDHAKLIKVCDLCYSFFKNKINCNYHFMGVMGNEMGVRYACENCGKKHFELNLVKRIQKARAVFPHKQKRVTNEDRLKNIQQRLKKLNLLNRFYCGVSFIIAS